MITEDYVSFETAKLLKEKGFDEECSCFYDNIIDYCTPGLEVDGQLYYKNSALDDEEYAAPTIQMAMKWLREIHNLVVNPVGYYVDGKLESWDVDIYFLDCGVDATIDAMGHVHGETHESACENGIEYCLENLI